MTRTELLSPVRWRSMSPYARAVVGCIGLATLFRARFLFTPLNTDEGGTLAIARAWAHGRDLYGDIFIDRPQALLVTYRVLNALTGGTTIAVRAMAMAFGAIAVLSCAEIARRLVSPRAGVVTALFAAVTTSAPAIEGFTACGELLSGALSAATVAVAAMTLSGRVGDRWMVAAGALGALAVSMKQSGFDGAMAVSVWLMLALAAGWGGRRRALYRLAAFATGALVVVLVIVVHAALTGWREWWYAVVGYRLDTRDRRVSWPRFFRTLSAARPILLPMVLAAITAGVAITLHRDRRPRRTEPRQALVLLWLLAAVPSFLMGGQFYNHYWIIVALPLSVVAGVVVGTLRRSGAVALLTVVAVCPALWSTWRFVSLPRSEVPRAIGADESSTREEQVARWFERVRRPGDSLYVLCAGASIYALAGVDPPYRALWFYEVHHVRGAQEELSTLLTSDDRPTFVVAIQKPEACGLTGENADLLDDHYNSFATVGGTDIYIRAGDERDADPRDALTASVQPISGLAAPPCSDRDLVGRHPFATSRTTAVIDRCPFSTR